MKNLFFVLVFVSCGSTLISVKVNAELIAHRGVHQTYDRYGLTNKTCTAIRIEKTGHQFLENTIESIEAAFHYHADIVELDVHPTTELNDEENLVVFHDWTLNCRTEATCEGGCMCSSQNECETHKQSLSFLQSLDIGHGYTFDNGKTFPFRGEHVGQMPRLEQVLDLLGQYPNKRLMINVKGNFKRTAKAFLRIVSKYPKSLRSRLLYPFQYGYAEDLIKLGVKDDIAQTSKECFKAYMKIGWLGIFPKECQNKKIMVPIRETLERVIGSPGRHIKFTSVLWGWPNKFLKLAQLNNTEVYASQVDSIKEFDLVTSMELNGIMTNKIELIGPYSQRKQ